MILKKIITILLVVALLPLMIPTTTVLAYDTKINTESIAKSNMGSPNTITLADYSGIDPSGLTFETNGSQTSIKAAIEAGDSVIITSGKGTITLDNPSYQSGVRPSIVIMDADITIDGSNRTTLKHIIRVRNEGVLTLKNINMTNESTDYCAIELSGGKLTLSNKTNINIYSAYGIVCYSATDLDGNPVINGNANNIDIQSGARLTVNCTAKAHNSIGLLLMDGNIDHGRKNATLESFRVAGEFSVVSNKNTDYSYGIYNSYSSIGNINISGKFVAQIGIYTMGDGGGTIVDEDPNRKGGSIQSITVAKSGQWISDIFRNAAGYCLDNEGLIDSIVIDGTVKGNVGLINDGIAKAIVINGKVTCKEVGVLNNYDISSLTVKGTINVETYKQVIKKSGTPINEVRACIYNNGLIDRLSVSNTLAGMYCIYNDNVTYGFLPTKYNSVNFNRAKFYGLIHGFKGSFKKYNRTKVEKVSKIDTPLKTVNIKKGSSLSTPHVIYNKNKRIKAHLYWESSNTDVAKVTQSGKIKAVKKGKATITAYSVIGKKLSIKVNVVNKNTKLKKFTVKAPKSIKVGKTKKLSIKLSQPKASGLKIKFKSSKPSGLHVDKAGKLSAKKKGKYTVTIKINNKSVKKSIVVK